MTVPRRLVPSDRRECSQLIAAANALTRESSTHFDPGERSVLRAAADLCWRRLAEDDAYVKATRPPLLP